MLQQWGIHWNFWLEVVSSEKRGNEKEWLKESQSILKNLKKVVSFCYFLWIRIVKYFFIFIKSNWNISILGYKHTLKNVSLDKQISYWNVYCNVKASFREILNLRKLGWLRTNLDLDPQPFWGDIFLRHKKWRFLESLIIHWLCPLSKPREVGMDSDKGICRPGIIHFHSWE